LWGVGAKAEKRLQALGVRTIGQLAALPEQVVVDHFGQAGRHLWQLAHGQDDRTVVPDREARSVSTETTFARDVEDRQVLRSWLLDLVDHLATRLRQARLQARSVTLKIRSSDFRTQTRAQALPEATNSTQALWQTAAELFERSLSPGLLPVRLLGVGAARLVRDEVVQGQLFDGGVGEQHTALDRAVDAIRAQYGKGAIRRGSLLGQRGAEPTDGEEK
jgi:DNA polymerase-4